MSDSEVIDPVVNEPEAEPVNLAEPMTEASPLKTIDDPLVKENFEQGLEIARLNGQRASDLAALSDLQTQLDFAEEENTDLLAQIEKKELEVKTLQDSISSITQSFNVCRSMLIHIGEVMKTIEDQRQYIQSLVNSPAVQAHISESANAKAG
jgi:chromosome segregation ATPase